MRIAISYPPIVNSRGQKAMVSQNRNVQFFKKPTYLMPVVHAQAATWLEKEGFEVLPGEHPITPVMFGDAAKAARFADLLLEKGVYVIAFSYPVVPHGQARIRTQVSAAHSKEDLAFAVGKFVETRREAE